MLIIKYPALFKGGVELLSLAYFILLSLVSYKREEEVLISKETQ
jgi:hypothetical protein